VCSSDLLYNPTLGIYYLQNDVFTLKRNIKHKRHTFSDNLATLTAQSQHTSNAFQFIRESAFRGQSTVYCSHLTGLLMRDDIYIHDNKIVPQLSN